MLSVKETRELLEGPRDGHAQLPPEFAIARHAALAIADEIHGRKVEHLLAARFGLVRQIEVAEKVRIVFRDYRTGIRDAEAVDGIGHGGTVAEWSARLIEGDLQHRVSD